MAIAERVQNQLSEHGIEYRLVPHPRTYSTRQSALEAYVAEDHIAKAVVVKDDGGYVMVVVPGNSRVKLEALQEELDRPLELAAEAQIEPLFLDCRPGAVPPLGRAYGLETCLDQALTTLANVYFEAGDHEELVHVSGEAFRTLLQGARQGHFSHE
jgi:Ala-tRNA(Pro) deacylase